MKIKVKLYSDLCTSSGESISGVVDVDSVFDVFGIPYIPGRRFKGVLRDAACELLDFKNSPYKLDDINRVFGKIGQFNSGELKIGNGYIKNYFEIIKEIKQLTNSNYAKFYKPDFITNYFVNFRTQTSIDRENRRAKKESLRVTRVVKKGLEFYFDITIKEEKDIQLIKDSCKILRHMGMNRTRGYGEVRCELLEDEKDYANEKIELKNGSKLKITYRNLSQLMLPGKNNDNTTTFDYLPGSTILGAFASLYVKKHNLKENAHENDTFYNLFLSNKVKFHNAYITNNEDNVYEPISLSLYKVKDGDEIYDKAIDDYQEPNEQLQRLSNIYISTEQNLLYKMEPQKRVEYHHLRPKSRNIGHAVKDEGVFFQYETLLGNQLFNGYIEGDKEYLQEIINLIPQDRIIYLGRSKSAQYGKVLIENIKIENDKSSNIIVDNEQCFVLKLLSPMILVNEFGQYYPDVNILHAEIKELIGDIDIENIFAKYTIISGFNNKWKLPKVQMQALSEGTTIVLKNISGKEIDISVLNNHSFGIRQNEGFGKVKVEKRKVAKYQFKSDKESSNINPNVTSNLLLNIQEELIQNEIETYAISKIDNMMTLNMTTINKLNDYLMLSLQYESFFEKINDIKDKNKKLRILSIVLDDDFYDERNIDFYCNSAKKLIRELISKLKIYKDKDMYVTKLSQSLNNADFKWFKIYIQSLLFFMKLKLRGEANVR